MNYSTMATSKLISISGWLEQVKRQGSFFGMELTQLAYDNINAELSAIDMEFDWRMGNDVTVTLLGEDNQPVGFEAVK